MSEVCSGQWTINNMIWALLKKITVPDEFHGQTQAVKSMLKDDVSGLVDSLTDFSVESATVDFSIETDNTTLTQTLKKWLDYINSEYRGQIPSGVKSLASEYFKERWKGSSFPILKLGKWEVIDNIKLPVTMFFVDGGSVFAQEKYPDDENLHALNYDYYIGQKTNKNNILSKNVIITKPYSRWMDKYPIPYLVKRGVYHNWRLIESIKGKQSDILDQVIPYLLVIKRGTEQLAVSDTKVYGNEEMKELAKQFQELSDKIGTQDGNKKTNIRVTQFDEDIKHFIPDLSTIFKSDLFSVAEKNILSGLGMVDIADATSYSRKESILNPKGFIEEVRTGINDFKHILKDLVAIIIDQNENHIKYNKSNFFITSSPVTSFMTSEFKDRIRSLYDRGRVSSQTAVELIGEVDFKTEIHRREEEAKNGVEYTMYPQITVNNEEKGVDLPNEVVTKKPLKDKIPLDKQGPEANNYKASSENELETAPYTDLKSLPPAVQKKLTAKQQKAWLDIFNSAYKFYSKKFSDKKKIESLAFRTAWSKVKKIRGE
jgi:cation transport regulator ChaB